MARIIIQTDRGTQVASFEFPDRLNYALIYMPGCPMNVGVHDMLNRLSRGLDDAARVTKRAEEAATRMAGGES